MAEMELLEALDQVEGGAESALGGVPGVRHRPEPSQVEVGMAQHVKPASRRLTRAQLDKLGLGFSQQSLRVGRIQGLEFETALDQGAVVVQGTAQAQLQLQRLPLPPAIGQHPPAGGVKQVAGMHPRAINPQLHLIGPPAQHQSGLGHGHRQLQLPPRRRASQAQTQLSPLASTRPDHQPPGRPIGAMVLAPGIIEGPAQPSSGLHATPKLLQIPTRIGWLRTCLKRFNRGGLPWSRGLRHRWMASRVP